MFSYKIMTTPIVTFQTGQGTENLHLDRSHCLVHVCYKVTRLNAQFKFKWLDQLYINWTLTKNDNLKGMDVERYAVSQS